METGFEAKVAGLEHFRNDARFSPRERAALEFAELMALDHKSIGDELFKRLREHFSAAEIIELGMAIGQYIGFGRLLAVLDLETPSCSIG